MQQHQQYALSARQQKRRGIKTGERTVQCNPPFVSDTGEHPPAVVKWGWGDVYNALDVV